MTCNRIWPVTGKIDPTVYMNSVVLHLDPPCRHVTAPVEARRYVRHMMAQKKDSLVGLVWALEGFLGSSSYIYVIVYNILWQVRLWFNVSHWFSSVDPVSVGARNFYTQNYF